MSPVRPAQVAYSRRRAESRHCDQDDGRERAFHDRAVVYLFGLPSVRDAEVFAAPADASGPVSPRVTSNSATAPSASSGSLGIRIRSNSPTGLQWHSNTTLQDRPQPVDRWVAGLPSAHAPSRYRVVREQLTQRDVLDDEIETTLDEQGIDTVFRKYESSISILDEWRSQPDEATL